MTSGAISIPDIASHAPADDFLPNSMVGLWGSRKSNASQMKLFIMKTRSTLSLKLGLLTAVVAAITVTTRAAERPALKDVYRDHFHVGVAINRPIAMGNNVRADNANRTLEQVRTDTAVVLEQFDQIAPENDLKWQLIHPNEGPDGYSFGPADAFVEFGIKHKMYIVGHTLVWHGQTPAWVFRGTNLPPGMTNVSNETVAPAGTNAPRRRFGGPRGFSGPRASREELLARMREHIHTVVGRYKGRIKCWDVVNEAISDRGTNVLRNSPWQQIIGPDFIAKAFEYAHEADPNAILRYNDYGLENPEKRRKLITLIKELQAQKVPIHAIGSQTHVSVSSPSFAGMDQTLTELAALGLPIHITELDVNSAQAGQQSASADLNENSATTQGGLVKDASQRLADQYASLFKAFVKHHESVKMVTLWGVNDGVSWRADGRPLLFDPDNQPKPAFDAVIRAATDGQANRPSKTSPPPSN
jgi:endo-1,4-beta-xylanase